MALDLAGQANGGRASKVALCMLLTRARGVFLVLALTLQHALFLILHAVESVIATLATKWKQPPSLARTHVREDACMRMQGNSSHARGTSVQTPAFHAMLI